MNKNILQKVLAMSEEAKDEFLKELFTTINRKAILKKSDFERFLESAEIVELIEISCKSKHIG